MEVSKDLFKYVVTASAREAMDEDYEVLLSEPVMQAFRMASPEPIVNGKPRMLLMTAWIVHEGRNENGQVFVKEELEQRVSQGLFAPPHAGMIDFNHDFEPRGFWYKASFAYDDQAQAWGILANGAVWAWRYSELADMIIAEIHRNGVVPVSMSAKPESVELVSEYPGAEGKHSAILHNPVFLTTSILDIPPADPHARADATEELVTTTSANVNADWILVPAANTVGAHSANFDFQVHSDPEVTDMEKDKELRQDLQELIEEKAKAENEARTAEEKLEVAEKAIGDYEVRVEEQGQKIAELEVALQSAHDENETLKKELDEVKVQLTEYDTQRVEAEKDTRLAVRLAELSEVVRKNLEGHPEKEALLSAWREASDEQWETIKSAFVLSSVSKDPDYVAKTQKEGRLLTAAPADHGGSRLSKHLR